MIEQTALATARRRRSPRKFHVIEIFGPTVQGEGPDAGKPCYFIRLGGCDYRCSWCDSPYAVDPAEVREHSERLTRYEIVERIKALPGAAELVVISGGNPALFQLNGVCKELQENGYKVSIETQGSKWRPWLSHVDRLVISPKAPSSGMATERHEWQTAEFMAAMEMYPTPAAIKIVVFDYNDYEWAIAFHERYPDEPFYLSVGTVQPDQIAAPKGVEKDHLIVQDILDRYRWLCEKVAIDARARKAIVLPQLHALCWGPSTRGV